MSKNKRRFIPLLVSIGVVVGILLGSFFASHFAGNRLNIINTSSNKINDLLHLVDDQYVDSVNIPDLVEKSMPGILAQLDPHSTYVSAKDVEASMQGLNGSFSGIGVQFTIYKDTVRIIQIVKGGPSESKGLQAGDCITAVDGKPFVGEVVTNDEVLKRLKGPKGSKVTLSIKRVGEKRIFNTTITRGDVPVKSIDAVYMATPSIGYIRITSFSSTTYPEFLAALARLNQSDFKGLVIDLRGNLGGYLDAAVKIANEFLPKGRLIVYTEGRKSPRHDYVSDGRGTYQNIPLVLLVDENTASASEILSGAIQDNDRGTVVGRRTFGKGLVQEAIEFRDNSMLRLTIARYYTPSGRCVQKPYKPGDELDYQEDLLLRAKHGEYYNADSIRANGEKYKTRLGRIVYGGGGIIPDKFIPLDTIGMTSYFKEAYLNGLMFQYAYVFTTTHHEALSKYKTEGEVVDYLQKQDLVNNFATFSAQNGLRRRNNLIKESASLIKRYIIARILDNQLGVQASIEYANSFDTGVKTAIAIIESGNAFPKVSTSQTSNTTAAISPSYSLQYGANAQLAKAYFFSPFVCFQNDGLYGVAGEDFDKQQKKIFLYFV